MRDDADADALARAVAGSVQARGGLFRIAASRIIATHALPDIIGQLSACIRTSTLL